MGIFRETQVGIFVENTVKQQVHLAASVKQQKLQGKTKRKHLALCQYDDMKSCDKQIWQHCFFL